MEKLRNLFPRGYLIVLEGIDGSGKTTLARFLYEQLMGSGIAAVSTKEPGATHTGKIIRSMVQNPIEKIPSLAEFFLFAADRVIHIDQVIKPALEKKNIVICDRMADSSLAYQGFGRKLSLSDIEIVNTIALQTIKPDITFYLEIDYATAHERIMKRNEALSQFDQEKESFFDRVIQGYDDIYKKRGDKVLNHNQMRALLEQIKNNMRDRRHYNQEGVFYLDASKTTQELAKDVYETILWTKGLYESE